DKEMDQGGLKRNGNQDDSLTFGETGARVGRDTGDTSGQLLQSAMHLPGPGSLPQPMVAPNGRVGTKDQGELGGLFEPPQQHVLNEGSDMEEGKISRMQKQQQQQHQDIGLFNMEDNLLKQSISDLDRTSTSVISTSASSVLGNLPLPDLFSQQIKQEGNFSLDKDLGSYSGHTGTGLCDLDGNSNRLMEESEIWQDLDLPSSLPEISDFELDSEVAHLDNILHDSRGGGGSVSGLVKETKSLIGNGVSCTSVNGTDQQQHPMHHQHHQQQHLLQHQQHQLHRQQDPASLLSSVMIKEEKDPDDSLIHIRTPGVIKQEKQDSADFCQSQCLQGSMSSLHGGGPHVLVYGCRCGTWLPLQSQPVLLVGPTRPEAFWHVLKLASGGELGRGEQDQLHIKVKITVECMFWPEPSSSAVAGQTKPSGQTHKICLVCSDEASGCHYGVVTCGSCKVFFKRAVEDSFMKYLLIIAELKGTGQVQTPRCQHNYLCAGRNDCIIDKIRRKNCPACRFRKCLQAGMNLEAPLHLPPCPYPPPSTEDIQDHQPLPNGDYRPGKEAAGKLHQRKAAGPDGITPRILKTCASQLSPVLGHLYNLSLSQEKVPMLWKTSCLVPVPKKSEAIRPGSLQTSRPHISCDGGVNDAVIYLLQRAHMHLDGGGGTVRITFFDFSSAFNTIQPLLLARKNKKLIKMKVQRPPGSSEPASSMPVPVIPRCMPQLVPTMLSVLKAIEPEIIYSGYDSTLPDTSSRLMTTLNRLGGQQVISAVKWAKSLPGFRNLHLDDQMTLLQCSWLFLMSFSLGWRSYEQCNGSMLCFAPDLVINKERMKLPFMNDQCEQMLKICNEFVRLQVSYDEYLCMKDGLKSQAVFDEIRMTYIKELGKAIVKREENASQNWQRFYQLTKLLDSMQEMVEGLLQICFYTFVNKTLSVEFPEMLAEIITNQIPKFKDGSVKPLLFHQK
ncbi:hypothetical protein L3Q82_022418, partial [Scortum barcoo]